MRTRTRVHSRRGRARCTSERRLCHKPLLAKVRCEASAGARACSEPNPECGPQEVIRRLCRVNDRDVGALQLRASPRATKYRICTRHTPPACGPYDCGERDNMKQTETASDVNIGTAAQSHSRTPGCTRCCAASAKGRGTPDALWGWFLRARGEGSAHGSSPCAVLLTLRSRRPDGRWRWYLGGATSRLFTASAPPTVRGLECGVEVKAGRRGAVPSAGRLGTAVLGGRRGSVRDDRMHIRIMYRPIDGAWRRTATRLTLGP